MAGSLEWRAAEADQQTVDRRLEPSTCSNLLHSVNLDGTRCPAPASLTLPITAQMPPALIASTISAHTSYFSSHPTLLSSLALKHSLFSAVRFACDLIIWYSERGPLQQQLLSTLIPLPLVCRTDNMADLVILSLERLVSTEETDKFLFTIYNLVIQHSYPILMYMCKGSNHPHHAIGHIQQENNENITQIKSAEPVEVECKVPEVKNAVKEVDKPTDGDVGTVEEEDKAVDEPSEFLIKLQTNPPSLQKPGTLPDNMEVILNTPSLEKIKSVASGPNLNRAVEMNPQYIRSSTPHSITPR